MTEFEPTTDLLLERVIDVPRHLVYAAWTQPEHLKKWFAPLPNTTPVAEIDLRPGGRSYIVMRSPEGEDMPNVGCVLECVENTRFTFTSAMLPGFRPPQTSGGGPLDFHFTAIISMDDATGGGTRYRAHVLHKDAADRQAHEEMGFHEGWGTCLDQLVATMQAVAQAG